MEKVIAEHLKNFSNNFRLLYNFELYKINNHYELINGRYKYCLIKKNFYIAEYISFNKNELVSIQIRPDSITLRGLYDKLCIKWVNGLIQTYQNLPLIIKWRDNGELEFFDYQDVSNNKHFVNICDVMKSSQEDLKTYADLFAIYLNYDLIKYFDYIQQLKREKLYIIYQDYKGKTNLLTTNLNLPEEKLIAEINLLKENPFQHILQL